MIQREETDLTNIGFVTLGGLERLDDFKMGTPIRAEDLTIMAYRPEFRNEPLDVTIVVVHTIHNLTYYLILVVVLYLVPILLAGYHGILRIRSRRPFKLNQIENKLDRFKKQYGKNVIQLVKLPVDQEEARFKRTSENGLWLSVCVANFLLVFCYVLNLMSTDKVADVKVNTITKLGDLLFDPDFKEMQPTGVGVFFEYEILKRSRPESELGLLYQRFKKNESRATLKLIAPSGAETLKNFLGYLFKDMEKNNDALVVVQANLLTVMRQALCAMATLLTGKDEDKLERIYVARNTFGTGITVNLYSKNVHPEIFRYMSYREQTIVEMANYWTYMEEAIEEMIQENLHGLGTSYKRLLCNKWVNENWDDDGDMPVLELGQLKISFLLLFIGGLAGFVAMLLEVLWFCF